MQQDVITDKEFGLFKRFIYEAVGISLSEIKKPLVSGRLSKRLHHHQLKSFDAYYKYISNPAHLAEKQIAIDLLTTNETHFFREPKHFDFLTNVVLPKRKLDKPFRVWSAASSSGEEPYTIAMLLDEHMPHSAWEVIASDVSSRVLKQAQAGCYSMKRAEEIPRKFLTKYCLKGTGDYQDSLLICKSLRQRVKFTSINLLHPFPDMGEFDVIFLRNVMIYFDVPTKQKIVSRMLPLLQKDGYLIISHSESLNGVSNDYKAIMPSVYQKV